MTTSLFSTFRGGENRVTSTFMAVLERLSLPNINRILGALMEDGDFSLVSFQNQPKRKRSIPDAVIGTGQSVVVETKTSPNALRGDQVKRELKDLTGSEKLLLLTPDEARPPLLCEAPLQGDRRVAWSNFITLAGAIENILNEEDDINEPPTEREAFLLREFLRMLQEDGLLSSSENKVLVIAAREAWPVYQEISTYVTHVRGHQPSGYLAFYADREIKTKVPKIERVIESVNLSEKGLAELEREDDRKRVRELLPNLNKIGRYENFTAKVFFLSGLDNPDTVRLDSPIENDKTGKNGKRVPFTFGAPRYVTLESLKKASKTSELKRR